MLRKIADPEMRALLRPPGWSGDHPPGPGDAPVLGLSYAQARAVAWLAGGHLPDGELLQAAAGRDLDRRYPWGQEIRPGVVAADPDRLTGPLSVHGLRPGASPFGLLHLLGNAAEFQSWQGSGPIAIAGGDYWTRPEDLAIGFTQEATERPDQSIPRAGLRVARVVVEQGIDANCASYLADLGARGPGAQGWARWELSHEGAVTLRLHSPVPIGGDAAADWTGRPFPDVGFPMAGFRTVGDRPLAWPAPDGEAARVRLLPVTGMAVHGDVIHGRIPLAAGDVVTEVVLPGGVRVDQVSPRPSEAYAHEGRVHLFFAPVPEVRGGVPLRRMQARIAFRVDGGLQAPSLAADRLAAAVAGLLEPADGGEDVADGWRILDAQRERPVDVCAGPRWVRW